MERAEAYADTAEKDREEQPEELPQEAHACGVSQAKDTLGKGCRTELRTGIVTVYWR